MQLIHKLVNRKINSGNMLESCWENAGIKLDLCRNQAESHVDMRLISWCSLSLEDDEEEDIVIIVNVRSF